MRVGWDLILISLQILQLHAVSVPSVSRPSLKKFLFRAAGWMYTGYSTEVAQDWRGLYGKVPNFEHLYLLYSC